MNPTRTIMLSLVLAATALTPTAALARNGADDNPRVADDKRGQRVVDAPTAAPAGNGADDNPTVADDKGGRRAVAAKDGGSKAKRVAGKCTAGSTSKLKVKPDDGRLETEFEVDQNRNGVTWKVTIRRNGTLAVKKNATTKAPSGSFSVERRLTDGSGSDKITARATSPSGEVCAAAISI